MHSTLQICLNFLLFRLLLAFLWRYVGSDLALLDTPGVSLGTLFGTLFRLLGLSRPLLDPSWFSFGAP